MALPLEVSAAIAKTQGTQGLRDALNCLDVMRDAAAGAYDIDTLSGATAEIAAVVHRHEFLDRLSDDECRLLVSAVTKYNASVPGSTRIGSGPLLELLNRKPSLLEISDYLTHHINATNDLQIASGIMDTVEVLPSLVDKKLGTLLFVARALVARQEGVSPDEVRRQINATNHTNVKSLNDHMGELRVTFSPWAVEFFELWIAINECCGGGSHRSLSPYHHMWLGHIYEQIADEYLVKRWRDPIQSAIDHYSYVVEAPGNLPNESLVFVTNHLVQLTLAVVRESPNNPVGRIALSAAVLAFKRGLSNVITLFGDVLQEMQQIQFDETKVVSDRRRSRGVLSLETGPADASILAVVHDDVTELSSTELMVLVPPTLQSPDMRVNVYADWPTIVEDSNDEGQIVAAAPGSYIAQLRTGRGEYTGKVHINVADHAKALTSVTQTFTVWERGHSYSADRPWTASRMYSAKDAAVTSDVIVVAVKNEDRLSIEVTGTAGVDFHTRYSLRFEPESDPRIFVENKLGQVRGLFDGRNKRGAEIYRRISHIGSSLSRELLTDNVMEYLEEHWHEVSTFSVITNDLSIPWELITIIADGDIRALCELFEFSVLPSEGPYADSLAVNELAISVRNTDPADFSLFNPNFQQDIDEITRSVATAGWRVRQVPLRRRPVLNAWHTETEGLWYVATHGVVADDLSEVLLETDYDEEDGSITLSDLVDRGVDLSGRFVFVNACNTVVSTPGPLRRIIWPQVLMKAGATGYRGARWPVADGAARLFAGTFFERIAIGDTLSRATLEARKAIRREYGDDDPNWLAYALFAHPSLKCQRKLGRR